MDWTSIITTVLSVIFGGLISAYFSWQGTKELRREAGNLQLLTKKLMLMMDDAGLIVDLPRSGRHVVVTQRPLLPV